MSSFTKDDETSQKISTSESEMGVQETFSGAFGACLVVFRYTRDAAQTDLTELVATHWYKPESLATVLDTSSSDVISLTVSFNAVFCLMRPKKLKR